MNEALLLNISETDIIILFLYQDIYKVKFSQILRKCAPGVSMIYERFVTDFPPTQNSHHTSHKLYKGEFINHINMLHNTSFTSRYLTKLPYNSLPLLHPIKAP